MGLMPVVIRGLHYRGYGAGVGIACSAFGQLLCMVLILSRVCAVRRSGVGDGHRGKRRRPGQLPWESAT